MEEHLFENIPGLEKLLEFKSFEDLSVREKEEIIRFMSREEYVKYRQAILKSRELFISEQTMIKADPSIRKKLLERMKQKHRHAGNGVSAFIFNLITFRVPVYQPGFAVAILAVLFVLLHHEKPETIRYLTKTDTVYLEKDINQNESAKMTYQDSTLKRIAGIDKKGPANMKAGHGAGAERPHEPLQSQYVQNAYQKIRMVHAIKSGRNAKEDSALMKFLVTVN